jgi:hypothetical protein
MTCGCSCSALDAVDTVGGFADHREFRVALQQRANAATEQRVIVDQQHADRFGARGGRLFHVFLVP